MLKLVVVRAVPKRYFSKSFMSGGKRNVVTIWNNLGGSIRLFTRLS